MQQGYVRLVLFAQEQPVISLAQCVCAMFSLFASCVHVCVIHTYEHLIAIVV